MEHVYKGAISSYLKKTIKLTNEKRALDEKLLVLQAELEGARNKTEHDKELLAIKDKELARLARYIYQFAQTSNSGNKKNKKNIKGISLPDFDVDSIKSEANNEEVKKLNDQLDIYIQTSDGLQEQLAYTLLALENLKKENESLKDLTSDDRSDKDTLIDSYANEVNILIARIEELETQLQVNTNHLENTNNELRVENKPLHDGNKYLQDEIESQAHKIDELFDQINEKTKNIDYLEKQNIALRNELNREREKGKQLAHNLNESVNLSKSLTERNEKLESKISIMQNSVSWRYTKMLRKIGSNKERKARLKRDRELVLSSEYFDEKWYSDKYPDYSKSTSDPLEFFLLIGMDRGDDPGPGFSSEAYAKKYPDVADSELTAFRHYIMHGMNEGRTL